MDTSAPDPVASSPRSSRRVSRRAALTAAGLLGLGAAGAAGVSALVLSNPNRPPRALPAGSLETPEQSLVFGDWTLELSSTGMRLSCGNTLAWMSTGPFLLTAHGHLEWTDEMGHFTATRHLDDVWSVQQVDTATTDGSTAELAGIFTDTAENALPWRLRLMADGSHLTLDLDCAAPGKSAPGPSDSTRPDSATLRSQQPDLLVLRGTPSPEQVLRGLGAQFTASDLRGDHYLMVTREQGVGRGQQPLTTLAEVTNNAGGSLSTTYAPLPVLMSDHVCVAWEADEAAEVDLREAGRMDIAVWAPSWRATITVADSPRELITAHTQRTGRIAALPAWTGTGAILGVQGGSTAVREKLAAVDDAGAQISAIWLQDWVGRRSADLGSRLWWTWELDRDSYPDWEDLVAEQHARGRRVLTYVNCFLTDPAQKSSPVSRNLYAEAADLGYLVRNPSGAVYDLEQGGFSAALVDLTHPEAVEWFTQVIVEQVAGVGASGWMADFAEGLPFDAQLADGDPAQWHNRWPVRWAEINSEAATRAGVPDPFIWHRSGWRGTASAAGAMWAGDQLVNWNAHDGLPSALRGMLAAGISGLSMMHADAGGYTALANPVVRTVREPELLARWSEMCTWTPVLRTHEGTLPDRNAQAYDPECAEHFAQQSRQFAALAPYREAAVAAAADSGLPIIRHAWVEHPGSKAAGHDDQFFFGDAFFVAPVMRPGAERREVVLPPGRWVLIWDQSTHEGTVQVLAPLGKPPVFYRLGDEEAAAIAQHVVKA